MSAGAGLREALGPLGVWSMGLRTTEDVGERADAAAELEELGYGALFVPGRDGGDVLEVVEALLAATRTISVATGILNVWAHEPEEVAARVAAFDRDHPGRMVLGLGVSHPILVDGDEPGRYRKPLSKMRAYLDALEAADVPPARRRMVLAALGPKMLALSGERTAGAHPYLVPVTHTRTAREVLGPHPVLAPEVAVVLDDDPGRATDRARAYVGRYLELFPNYVQNFLRQGFTEEDVRAGGSARLIDALVVRGDEAAVRDRVAEHRAAGADHLCLQVVPRGDELPRDEWRRLAAALIDQVPAAGVPGDGRRAS